MQEYNAYILVYLPWKLEIVSEETLNLRQKTDAFDKNNNVIQWNGRLKRKILKNNVGELGLAAYDILNQNIGFSRNINSNFISERTYNTFRRYFMLSFTWNFSKNGKPLQW